MCQPTTVANSPAASCILASAPFTARTRRCTPRRCRAPATGAGASSASACATRASLDVLADQDHLYSVTERHGDEARTRVVGVLLDALLAPRAMPKVVAAIADPATTIVTSTVTEKGYSQNPANAELDLDDSDIRHDLANPDSPKTTLGVLAAGIRRRACGCAAHASSAATTWRATATRCASCWCSIRGLLDPVLAQRIEHDIALPNSMVDRIVPAATPRVAGLGRAASGPARRSGDRLRTLHAMGHRRPLRRAAARHGKTQAPLLTGDVRPYQAMKLRLLNGTHSAIAYAGQLCGLETFPTPWPIAGRRLRAAT